MPCRPVLRISRLRPDLAFTFVPGFSTVPLADRVIPAVLSFSTITVLARFAIRRLTRCCQFLRLLARFRWSLCSLSLVLMRRRDPLRWWASPALVAPDLRIKPARIGRGDDLGPSGRVHHRHLADVHVHARRDPGVRNNFSFPHLKLTRTTVSPPAVPCMNTTSYDVYQFPVWTNMNVRFFINT